jgi:putative endonuclease
MTVGHDWISDHQIVSGSQKKLKPVTLNLFQGLSSANTTLTVNHMILMYKMTKRLDFQPCVYIMASFNGQAIYIGVTSDLMRRIGQHREGYFDGHSKKYKTHRLVLFEVFGDMDSAIAREKQLKNWRRQWKINHVTATNPKWRDLAEDLGFPPLATY